MPGAKQRSGGARKGTGPIRRRFTLSTPGAMFIRVETQARLHRKDVTEEELNATLEAIVLEYARNLKIPEP